MTIFWQYFLYIFLFNLILVLIILIFPLERYPLSILKTFSQNQTQVITFLVLSAISALTVSSLLSNKINTSCRILIKRVKGMTGSENTDSQSGSTLENNFLNLENSIKEMSTAQNDAISRLNSEKNQLLILVNSINEGVVVVSKDGKITLSNNEFNNMFDIAENPEGRHYWEVIRISEIKALIETAFETRLSTAKEISLIYPYEKFYFVNIITLDSPEDEIIAIFYDITEFKNLEKVKAELIANVSHELRTPLTAIKGYVETLDNEAYDTIDQQSKFLNIIKKHTQRLIDIVSDLLVLSEIEVKESEKIVRYTEQYDNLSINDILLSCHDSLKSKIGSKNLVFEKDLQESLPDIRGNQFVLEQAFINLLDNAIKYTPEGGSIGFKTSHNDDKVEIEIFDTGIGIPKESMPRIFERFYRVDKDRSRKEGGTGLGLSIVKHTINIHGGEIRVESEMSKGTRFIINLPSEPKH